MKPCLGIVDWGIGGVGIHKLIKSRLGNVPIIYFSDTGVTAYGRMSRDELVSRLNLVIAFLESKEITHLVVGCNAASTVVPFLSVTGMEVAGVIDAAVSLTLKSRPTRLVLLGGRRTVLSGIYRRALADRGLDVRQRIAQPLSAMIEDGDISSLKLHEECKRILSPVKTCSHLLLACTHYPAIIPVLQEFISKDTVVIDPAPEVVKIVKSWRLQPVGTDLFFTTGDPEKMQKSSWNAFGVKIKKAEKVRI